MYVCKILFEFLLTINFMLKKKRLIFKTFNFFTI